MKTFEEAIQTAVPMREVTGVATMANLLKQAADLDHAQQRYRELAEETKNNQLYRFMSNTLRLQVDAHLVKLADAILTAFMTGLVTGIEMEKDPNFVEPEIGPTDFHGSDGGPMPAKATVGYQTTVTPTDDDAPCSERQINIVFSRDGVLLLIQAASVYDEPEYIRIGSPVARVGFELSETMCSRIEDAMRSVRERKGWVRR